MNLLLAVIDDLYSFAVESLSGRSKEKKENEISVEYYAEEDISSILEDIQIPVEEGYSTFRGVGEIIEEEKQEIYPAPGGKNTLMYVGGNETPMFLRATKEFDSVVAKLPYGAMVMVLEQNGRWARAVYNTFTGWILREDLVDRAAYVYPQFVLNEQNTAHDPNTIRIRAMLDDAFAGGVSELDLQAPEYVTYRLMRKGLTIPWPETRPRTPGLWHKILKGAAGVHIGVVPKTGSVMEYMLSEDTGHLAYVEAVFPDETINISEVHYPDRGIYNERVLTREEWMELKPLFIQVT